jgi:hypothetical protein
MRRPVDLVALACPLLAALACARCDGEWSFTIPPWDAGAPGAMDMSACSAWAESRCTYEDRCPGPIYAQMDHSVCVARAVIGCELLAGDPNVAFDAATVASCAYPTDCSAVPLSAARMCLPPGRGPVGAPCVFGAGCQTYRCVYTLDEAEGQWSSCGACADVCDPPCDDGGLCVCGLPDAGPTCVAQPAIGQSCTGPRPCQGGYCRGATADGGGVCAPLAALGEACGDGTSAPPCGDVNSYCDGDTHVCRSPLPASYGAPCGFAQDEEYVCAAYGTCGADGTGTCVAPSPDGALCDPSQGLRCLPPASCIASHCLFPSLADCAL